MKHYFNHNLNQDDATMLTKEALDSYCDKYSEFQPKVAWNNHQAEIALVVAGSKLKGVVEVEPGRIGLDMNIPFLLRPFKKKAIDVIQKEITTWMQRYDKYIA